MPLVELERSPRGRRRIFVRAQLPFVITAAFVFAAIAVGAPASLSAPLVIAAAAAIALASGASALLPWERIHSSWLILVALTDLVAVALLRTEMLPILPSVTMLAVFPILWLAYGFPPIAFTVAVGGAALITSFRFFWSGVWPTTSIEWMNVLTLPGLILALAVVVNIAAQQLRRNNVRLAATHRARERALHRAVDNELVVRSVLDTVTSAVVMFDADGKPALTNRTADRLAASMGFRLQGPPYGGDLVLAADRETPVPHDAQAIPRALRGERIAGEMEWVGHTDDLRAIIVTAGQVKRPDGSVIGTVVAAYDVTELAESVEIRENFLRTVSHELRTPLTSITGYLDLISERAGDTDATLARHLHAAERNVLALTERLNELFAASATDSPLVHHPVVLSELIASSVAAVLPLAHARGTSIEQIQVSEARVDLDPIRIRQALSELLVNAVKFSPPASAIVVGQDVDGARARIRVVDPGPGLTRAEQSRMFDRFYRAPFAQRNAIQGFGIGLSLVRSAAKAHGGRVRVETSTDSGTTMTLELPLAPVVADGAAPRTASLGVVPAGV